MISAKEIAVLSSYNFISDEVRKTGENRKGNSQLLCLRKGELSTVATADITCLELFKKIFGCGKLAGVQLSLSKISKYLCKKDLSGLDSCVALQGIAARCLFYKKDTSNDGISKLWKKISQPLHIHLRQLQKSCSRRYEISFSSLGESKVEVYATKGATLDHLIVQTEIWLKKQGRPVKEAMEVQGPTEWVRIGYTYDGPGRGYSYKGYQPNADVFDGDTPIDQVRLDRLTFRAITQILLPCSVSYGGF